MPSTPAQEHSCEIDYEDLPDEDIGLDEQPLDERPVIRSITDPSTDEVTLYTHGTALRLRLNNGEAALDKALAAIGLGTLSEEWCILRRWQEGWRVQIRGSVWLGGRKPGWGKNKNSPLAALNGRLGLTLYVLGHEVTKEDTYLDVATVHAGDLDRLLRRMELTETDCTIEYFTQAERYMVLLPHEARRLAAALGGEEAQGRHREAAKGFLLQEVTFPVRVRDRATMQATLKIYRVSPGSTTAYRVEASLRGNRRTGTTFFQEDIQQLDDLLLGLVAAHDLHPVAKPAKWEPTLPTRVDLAPRDVALRRMRGGAWRGKKVTPQVRQTIANLHTPLAPPGWLWALPASTEGVSARVNTTYPPSSCSPSPSDPSSTSLSSTDLTSSASSPSDSAVSSTSIAVEVEWDRLLEDPRLPGVTLYRRRGEAVLPPRVRVGPWSTTDPYLALLDEIERGCELTEIVLDPQHDPTEVVDRIADRFGGRISLFVRAQVDATGRPDTWHGLPPRLERYAPDPAAEAFVFVVDPSVVATIDDAYLAFDEEDVEFKPGPLRKRRGKGTTVTAAHWHAVALGGLLADELEAIRDACEHGGCRAVLITVDSRPARGLADFEKSHGWRDTRVRSIVGDAGRHCSHRRVLVERDRGGDVRQVVSWRDGAEGKTGRVLYQATRPESVSPRRRRSRGSSAGNTTT